MSSIELKESPWLNYFYYWSIKMHLSPHGISKSYTTVIFSLILGLMFLPSLALADNQINTGDTAWMITATALVLMMTIPGISLFYAGMVRSKNVLSVLMQCFTITSLISILWIIYGYSIAFGDASPLWGGLNAAFLKGVDSQSLVGTIPESVFLMFQMTFAIITPALIIGAFAERMRFSALLWFMVAWFTFVYLPICHWVWGENGWLEGIGILDFAGGTVVHINAGVAGLIGAILLGRRRGYQITQMQPHNLVLTLIGASLLWVGWFGFNAGSELAANGNTGMIMLVTQVASAAAALTWMFCEWLTHGKPSVLGIVSGAVAGLIAITPACGFVGPMGSLAIGVIASVTCFIFVTKIKHILGYDDTLDVFGIHGIGGIVGALLTGVFAAESLGGSGFGDGISSMLQQINVQFFGVVVTIIYTGIVSYIILKIVDRFISLRVSKEEEIEGLDLASHDERNYIL